MPSMACPHCKKTINFKEADAGKKAMCKHCKQRLQLAAPAPAPAAPAAEGNPLDFGGGADAGGGAGGTVAALDFNAGPGGAPALVSTGHDPQARRWARLAKANGLILLGMWLITLTLLVVGGWQLVSVGRHGATAAVTVQDWSAVLHEGFSHNDGTGKSAHLSNIGYAVGMTLIALSGLLVVVGFLMSFGAPVQGKFWPAPAILLFLIGLALFTCLWPTLWGLRQTPLDRHFGDAEINLARPERAELQAWIIEGVFLTCLFLALLSFASYQQHLRKAAQQLNLANRILLPFLVLALLHLGFWLLAWGSGIGLSLAGTSLSVRSWLTIGVFTLWSLLMLATMLFGTILCISLNRSIRKPPPAPAPPTA